MYQLNYESTTLERSILLSLILWPLLLLLFYSNFVERWPININQTIDVWIKIAGPSIFPTSNTDMAMEIATTQQELGYREIDNNLYVNNQGLTVNVCDKRKATTCTAP